MSDISKFQALADKVSGSAVPDLGAFAQMYIDAFSKGYNYAFGVAAVAMIFSTLVYMIFNKHLPNKERSESKKKVGETPFAFIYALVGAAVSGGLVYLISQNLDMSFAIGLFVGFVAWIVKISTKEERPRIVALLQVFVVVIFFWMSFHQNGLTLTFFARDYTVKAVGPFTSIFFNLGPMLIFIAAVAGFFILLLKKKVLSKAIGAAMLLAFGYLTYQYVAQNPSLNPIEPEVFQSFNPLFIVTLTFPVMGIFAWLNRKNMEPSTPKKIGIGMIIASVGFLIVLVASLKLVSPHLLQYVDEFGKQAYNPVPDASRVSPYWLINSYLILTIAELFLSPMGLSFVSKVAPVRFQGVMQGGWLLATAVATNCCLWAVSSGENWTCGSCGRSLSSVVCCRRDSFFRS